MDRDEGVFIDLIVASERIAEWLDVLRSDGSLQRCLLLEPRILNCSTSAIFWADSSTLVDRREQALKALALHVVKSQAYAEEVWHASHEPNVGCEILQVA